MASPLKKDRLDDDLTTADLANAQNSDRASRERKPLLAPDNLQTAPGNVKEIPVRVETARRDYQAPGATSRTLDEQTLGRPTDEAPGNLLESPRRLDSSVTDLEADEAELSERPADFLNKSSQSARRTDGALDENALNEIDGKDSSVSDAWRKADDSPTASDTRRKFDGTSDSSAAHLFPSDELENLRGRWKEVQTAFVDEPRSAVEQADGLVASAMKRLAEVFADERSNLEKQWDSGDNVSTEDLRLALQRYRTFFERLLAV